MLSLQDYIKNSELQARLGLRMPSDKELKCIQNTLLEMYKDILYICEKKQVTVFLGGGSALGAVRHGGFIPWDDDMDLMISRKDIRIFIDAFAKEFHEKYEISSPLGNTPYTDVVPRIYKKGTLLQNLFDKSKLTPSGIFIDLTIMEYVPESRIWNIIHGSISNMLFFLINSKGMYLCRNKKTYKFFAASLKSGLFYIFRLLVGMGMCFISYRKFCILYDRWTSLCSYSKLLSIPVGRKHYFGEMLSYDTFFPAKEIFFAGVKAYVPNDVHFYLKNLYGDNYNELPPVEKRESHPFVQIKLS